MENLHYVIRKDRSKNFWGIAVDGTLLDNTGPHDTVEAAMSATSSFGTLILDGGC